ncbi:ABC transporter permease [Candidatus Woesearchaeota archaeon]|nr:MAG: ABC transporter permease [Candidatus Woesearchaeota archaeon]
MIREYFLYALKNIKRQHIRSYLTLIGIIVSVAALVMLVSLGEGLKGAITEQFEQLGSDQLSIFLDGGDPSFSTGLTTDDVEFVRKFPYFENVAPYLVEQGVKVTFDGKDAFAPITAWRPEDQFYIFEKTGFETEKGRLFNKGERYAVVLGHLAADTYFDDTIHVRNSIEIEGIKFKVVGILEQIGNNQDDNTIGIPFETAQELFGDKVNFIQTIVKPGLDIDKVSEIIEKELEDYRGREDILVLTPEQILEFLNNVLGGITVILSAIAFIALIVGAIGIMNSMYTNVLERTKEIGIMKSVGARQRDILLFFLFEAGMIGAIGGIIGTILGVVLAFGAGELISAANFLPIKVTVEWWVVLLAISFATFTGMISGLLPSYQASRLAPVEALRYD